MKRIIYIIAILISALLLKSCSSSSQAEPFVLDLSENSLAMSRVARPGKVSVFILATHWCSPCKKLFKDAQRELDMDQVDVFYCLLSKSSQDDFRLMNERSSYLYWKHIQDATSSFPFVYVLDQATNIRHTLEAPRIDALAKVTDQLVEEGKQYNYSTRLLKTSLNGTSNKLLTKSKEILKLDTIVRIDSVIVQQKLNVDSIIQIGTQSEFDRMNQIIEEFVLERAKKDTAKANWLLREARQLDDGFFGINKAKLTLIRMAEDHYIESLKVLNCRKELNAVRNEFPKYL